MNNGDRGSEPAMRGDKTRDDSDYENRGTKYGYWHSGGGGDCTDGGVRSYYKCDGKNG